MRVVIIWRDDADYSRSVTEWLGDFKRRTGREPESVSPDSPEGESLCRLYDVVEYPTIIALDNDGKLLQMWRGTMFPRIDDVNYYLIG